MIVVFCFNVLLITDNIYWTMTPAYFSSSGTYVQGNGYRYYIRAFFARNMYVKANGSFAWGNYSPYNATNGSAVSNGVRPAISLKKGVEYSSGDGSITNPYIAVTK